MKRIALFIILACAFVFCTSCEKSQGNKNTAVNVNNNAAVEETEDTNAEIDSELFEVLPDEAMDSFNFVTDNAKKLFPDAKGKWMYGYKGMIIVDEAQCYEFALYTYKSKVHTKLGTVAVAADNTTLYVLDEASGEYSVTEIPQEEIAQTSWAQTVTLAFAKAN